MNDFTKEELQEMLGATITLSIFYKQELMDSLRIKLQSLIDNYDEPKECEHASDGMIYASYPPMNKCKKCGEFYR